MKCKVCKEEINLTIFGMPNDICWGCLQDEQKKDVVNENVKVKIKKPKQISAVDWLVEQIKNNVHNSSEEFELIVNQAKLMEHEQRGNSFIEGYKKRAELSNLIFDKLSELFAKELFNKNNKPS